MVFRDEPACAGQAQMEQIVVSGSRPKRMRRVAAFPAELIESQVNKILTWKYGKNDLAHNMTLCGIFAILSVLI